MTLCADQADCRLLRQIDQRQTQFRSLAAAQPGRRFVDGDFERRPDDSFQEVTAAGRAVAQANDGVHVQAGLAIVVQRAFAIGRQCVQLDRLYPALVAMGIGVWMGLWWITEANSSHAPKLSVVPRLASCVRKLEYGMPLGDLPSSSVSNPPTMFR